MPCAFSNIEVDPRIIEIPVAPMTKKSSRFSTVSPYHKAIVAIGDMQDAKQVISFLDTFKAQLPFRELIFLHILSQNDVQSAVEILDQEKELLHSIRQWVPKEEATRYTVLIKAGLILPTILKTASEKKADLLIIGQNRLTLHHQLYPDRLLQESKIDILVVPENIEKATERKLLLVPVDFVHDSLKTIKKILPIAAANEKTTITIIHFIKTQKHIAEKSVQEMSRVFKAAEKELLQILDSLEPREKSCINAVIEESNAQNPAEAIADYSLNEKIDLLILDVGKKTSLQKILNPSISDALLHMPFNFPILLLTHTNKN